MSSATHIVRACDYCGLDFSGPGYCPDEQQAYCCYGCFVVQRILGTRGEEGIATWILLRLGIGAFLAMNVMMMSMILYVQTAAELGASVVRGLNWGMLALSTPALIILGGPFFAGGVRELRRWHLSTDALIATGSLAAYAVSAANVVRGSGHVYFDTATMLLLIVTLGRLLEASAKNHTSQAIRDMLTLAPKTARVIREGHEVEIDSGDVKKGDMMIVRPGESIPADGRILTGNALVEESAFTGEARPRSCSPGDQLYGGSANCDGLMTVEATAVGSDSVLAQIARMVRQAQRERAPVERLTERVSAVFVPVVWLAALGAAAYWALAYGNVERAGLSAMAVLVVACPCALGLATPLATCIAIGKAASAGVLARSGETLERLPRVSKMFFDKTGTLTMNRLAVTEVRTAAGTSIEEVLAWAGPVAAASEHSVARAIVEAARSKGVAGGSIRDFAAVPGFGVEGTVTVDGATRRVVLGSLKLLSRQHEAPAELIPASDAAPLTAAYVGCDGKVRGAIYFSDEVRPGAKAVIERLKAAEVEPAVVSGDVEGPTRRLAAELGIAAVFAERTPAGKVEIVREAQESGGVRVAFVGDGINDAPALAQADVGIAIGGGTDLARQAGTVTLLGDDLSRIPWLLELARLTHKVIRQNLWWAFGYNSAAIALAFFGYVHPLVAASAMFVSSLSVIANSMRVNRFPTTRGDPVCKQATSKST